VQKVTLIPIAGLTLLLLATTGLACNSDKSLRESGQLIVYAAREETLVGPIVDQFSEATGIKVQVKYGGTAQIVATLLEEGKKSPADVFWTRDPGGLGALSSMLDPLPQDILTLVPTWARANNENWVGISARIRAVAYNTERVSPEDLPDSIWGFTDPLWEGRIGWSPTSGPTQTMITAMRIMWGDEKTRQWLRAVQTNKLAIYGNHTAVVAAVSTGEVDIGLVNHYYAHRFRQEHGEDFPVRNYYFQEGGPGNLAMISGAGVLSTAKNRENAEAFLRFMLSEAAQRYFTFQTFEYPVVEGIATNQVLTPLSEINRPETSMDDLGDLRGTLAMLRDLGILP